VRSGDGLITITYDDSTPPAVTVSGTPTGQNGWFNTSPATLIVVATDAGLGDSPITALSGTAGAGGGGGGTTGGTGAAHVGAGGGHVRTGHSHGQCGDHRRAPLAMPAR
jgi:hypothetical protein